MSTSDPSGLGLTDHGLPDAQALAQLANQFFQALPGAAPVNPGLPAGLPAGLSHLGSPSSAHPFAVPSTPAAFPTSPIDNGFSPSLVPSAATAAPAAAASAAQQSLPSGVPGASGYEGIPT